MNERIRELAEQAGITTNLDTDFFEKDYNKWVDYYSVKFTELIVKECALLCVSRPGPGDDVRSREHCAEQIREHFGIGDNT